MPRRDDIETILVIGAGPIVIGQACEFDYSGSQGCKALREEGYRVVLVNSNPATIMTDPEMADRTYVEPITAESVEKIIAAERPDVLLPTLGGQTALNLTVELSESGVLERYGVELIGAQLESIHKAEDREAFRIAMQRIGLKLPASGFAHSLEEARLIVEKTGIPAIIRPSFTLGGTGSSVAFSDEEFDPLVEWALRQSPQHTCLIEQSALGWKEYELEVMRDSADNVVIICSIENFDPMGVHTGDSITVAPAQTLTDREYQEMRDAAIAIIREIGVDTGGSNIQFAVSPEDGTLIVIEMNPRVSRSSALASKATGFPIAKIAAKLAVGYTLDEIRNDITRETPASFEPSIDYVVTKIPRFTFEKFPGVDDVLTTQMKSVGEVMSIGRTFKESLQKAIRSLEVGHTGFEVPDLAEGAEGDEALWRSIDTPRPGRLWALAEAFRRGASLEELSRRSQIDPWFLRNLEQIVALERELAAAEGDERRDRLREAKRAGFSDLRLAALWGVSEAEVRGLRREVGVRPVYKRVDTCAAEFEAHTPYLYSTYERECEARPSDRRKVVILGGGPNRIGQGIEFDYCCVHAAFALTDAGFETIMVNCNPETVSTDYDTSDRLYFEPLTLEDVIEVVECEKPEGLIVQFGGQTPLRLAVALEQAGVPILGTTPDAIDRAEDRERFDALLETLQLRRPPGQVARSSEEAEAVAERIGYPVLVRPSYVLGGRAMEIVHDAESLRRYMHFAVQASPEHPVLVDRFLADATEVDVDAVCDGERVVIGGIMEHIEQAGVHSGDSACSLPPYSLSLSVVDEISASTRKLALELGVLGLVNIQYAVKRGEVFVIEVNPRASRTVPFVSKAIGRPLAKIAALVMVGKSLAELDFTEEIWPRHYSVKEAVFPFVKFPGADTLLGPEMKSTGEVMGIDSEFGRAYAKAQIEAGNRPPISGTVFVSVRAEDRPGLVDAVKELAENGFRVLATPGTAVDFGERGISTETVPKVGHGHPDTVERIEAGEVDLVINTTGQNPVSVRDSASIRRSALLRGVPYFTTLAGARAAVGAIRALRLQSIGVRALQDIHTA
ncbi:MAG: carbamoyl-phosphate synthase large subunit [Myxococcota bacterium]|nr:carbamoyl-phosphate synthase large subunit [Myxococcota bacterium]MDP7076466.1 carbamoyl-phosphate synthase large subunit [Myxococcota bacterium]MDP7298053.1 carbamoyl-phosphate synthase large subunit [Myxococcota bacterium]MDP7431689.1 carbamoyl-phosphate synthase large subunit [Myxococcota bacterium]HJO22868.1 carbamoyl-phosphate synthase large subunit [Myxococcota bacterium]